MKLADEWVVMQDGSKDKMLVAEREACLVYLLVASMGCD